MKLRIEKRGGRGGGERRGEEEKEEEDEYRSQKYTQTRHPTLLL